VSGVETVEEMLELILIRHGECDANRERSYIGWRDSPLTPAGVAATVALRSVLPVPDAVHTSDLGRALKSAGLAFPDIEVRGDARLRELDFGIFEGATYDENVMRHGERFRAWIEDPWNVRPDGGETLGELSLRIDSWLASVMEEYRALWVARPDRPPLIIAFTHGGVIRTIAARALGIRYQDVHGMVRPCEALRFTVADDGTLSLLEPA